MCFTNVKRIQFMSVQGGLQDKVNTLPDLSGNYHWWLREKKTNKIIDPSPNYDGSNSSWKTGKRRYFPFHRDTTEAKFLDLHNKHIEYYKKQGKDFNIVLDLLGSRNLYKKGMCFSNAVAYMTCNGGPDKYELVSGACGYEIDTFNGCYPFPNMDDKVVKYINLDWGY